MATSGKLQLTRRAILVASALLAVVGIYRLSRAFVVNGELRFGNPVSSAVARIDPSERSFAPRRVRAEVTRVRGNQVVKPGARCEFLVQKKPLDNGTFYCNAQVMCASKLVYGGPNAGYFICALYEVPRRDVVGTDPATTRQDHDPAMHLDTQAGVLRVWDDERGALGAFELEADVLSVE